MNPHLYDSDMGALSLVYGPLVNLDKQRKIIPWLAKSREMLDGCRRITMKLREDVKFTDGQPFSYLPLGGVGQVAIRPDFPAASGKGFKKKKCGGVP